MNNKAEVFTDAHGTSFTPWSDGVAIGFKITNPRSQRVEYLFLNPSSESDDGVSNVFLYHTGGPGDEGPREFSGPITYVDVLKEESHASGATSVYDKASVAKRQIETGNQSRDPAR